MWYGKAIGPKSGETGQSMRPGRFKPRNVMA